MVKVNWSYLPANPEAAICIPITVEADEQWSFVQNKSHQRWLWVVLGHHTHEVIAYTFGSRKEAVFKRLMSLLKPFPIHLWFTDGLQAYQKILDCEKHKIGKRNTQKIERFFLTLRTRIKRLARRTICFSKSDCMHDTVIGLFINRYHFHRKV